MARAGSSREVLSSVVEAIYDCTLNPGRWRDTLLRVGELTQSTHVAMGTMDYEHGQLLNPVEYGYDPTYWKLYLERYSVNPLMRRSHRVFSWSRVHDSNARGLGRLPQERVL